MKDQFIPKLIMGLDLDSPVKESTVIKLSSIYRSKNKTEFTDYSTDRRSASYKPSITKKSSQIYSKAISMHEGGEEDQ